mmetsp:Transcript_16843/g.46234  ORF Transcript_16843/g.46234 Transcript_16843/m.46234 type:complete len:330 (+) Transcript_16843:157-1146(+)
MKDCETYPPGSPCLDRQESALGTGDEAMGYGAITNSIEEGVESSRAKHALGFLALDDDATTHKVDATVSGADRIDHRFRELLYPRIRTSKRYYSLLALAYLFCCAFAFVGLHHSTQANGTTSDKMALSDLFFFDDLFRGGSKRRSPVASLERPPSFERSLLLVVNAEVTPSNRIVQDIDRQLTAKGMQDAEGLGLYLKEHNIPEPDWIFTSPSERTAFTTELIRRHWASNAPVAFEDILYTLEFNDYFTFVTGLNDNFRRVMIVGHNPAILNTARKLMKTHGIEDFPDAGLMEIRWDSLHNWHTVVYYSGSTKMAVDPNNNFLYSERPS